MRAKTLVNVIPLEAGMAVAKRRLQRVLQRVAPGYHPEQSDIVAL